MPKITDNTHVEEGMVWGKVSTKVVGSTCEFPICEVEEWEKLTDKEAEKLAMESLFESGQMEWWY